MEIDAWIDKANTYFVSFIVLCFQFLSWSLFQSSPMIMNHG